SRALRADAERLAPALRDDAQVGCVLAMMRANEVGFGELERSVAAWSEAVVWARRAGNLRQLAMSLSNRGTVLDELGDYQAAIVDHRESLRLLEGRAVPNITHYARLNLGLSLGKLGELEAGRRELGA